MSVVEAVPLADNVTVNVIVLVGSEENPFSSSKDTLVLRFFNNVVAKDPTLSPLCASGSVLHRQDDTLVPLGLPLWQCRSDPANDYEAVVFTLKPPASAPTAAGPGVPGGGGAGQELPPLHLPSGLVNPYYRNRFREAMFTVLQGAHDVPLCCGFFISDTFAVSVHHRTDGANPVIADVLKAKTRRGDAEITIHLRVVGTNEKYDFILLQLLEDQLPAKSFLPLASVTNSVDVSSAHALLVLENIAADDAGNEAGEAMPFTSFRQVDVCHVSKRYLGYATPTAGGDSGGALVLRDMTVVGMHLGGWNHSRETINNLSSTDEEEECDPAIAESKKRKWYEILKKRVHALHVCDKSVAKSLLSVQEEIMTGGWALFLCYPEIRAELESMVEAAGSPRQILCLNTII